MTTTADASADHASSRTPRRISRLSVPELDELTKPAVNLDALRGLGLTDNEILEGISIAAFIGATNRIGVALSVPPNPEYTGIPQ